MSTMPKLAASNRPFATVLLDVCARAAPLRNQLRRSFRVRCSARTKGPILNDIRNSADQAAVATATKQQDLLPTPVTQWWRLTPATSFDVVALLEMRASLEDRHASVIPCNWSSVRSRDASFAVARRRSLAMHAVGVRLNRMAMIRQRRPRESDAPRLPRAG
jgi:hypothetical protein